MFLLYSWGSLFGVPNKVPLPKQTSSRMLHQRIWATLYNGEANLQERGEWNGNWDYNMAVNKVMGGLCSGYPKMLRPRLRNSVASLNPKP